MKKSILAVVAGLGLFAAAPAANAGFVLNGTQTPALSSGGFDAYVISAFNDGAGGSGAQLASFDVTVSTAGSTAATAMRVNLRDIDNDTVLDANVLGTGMSFTNSAQYILGTFARIGAVNAFNALTVEPGPATTDSDGDGEADRAFATAFSNLHSLHIAGFPAAAAAASAGAGAPFMVVVVPTGVSAMADINVGSETAVGQTFLSTPIGVPEPTSFAMLGLAGLGVLARRRRA